MGRDEKIIKVAIMAKVGLPRWCNGKESACQHRRHRDMGSTPESGRSPGVGNGNPLQYSCQRNLVGYNPWGHKESDMTEQLSTHRHT